MTLVHRGGLRQPSAASFPQVLRSPEVGKREGGGENDLGGAERHGAPERGNRLGRHFGSFEPFPERFGDRDGLALAAHQDVPRVAFGHELVLVVDAQFVLELQ